ncbi:MAG: flagellar basal-body MS-ring/collar protein FliF [Armatimonadota bacterium]|nr:flagellar basal-body MS-ring/collar protein FliF [Armatimonadota bacterium]
MDQFSKLGPVQAVSQFWKSLTSPQKLITAMFVAAAVVLMGVVSVVAARPRMEVLFSGLQAEDAGAIVAKLQERKIDYQIDSGGSAIMVPAKNVHELRMQMAADRLPQGGVVGFEIFDKTNLGMTEFAQRLQYQRALQGELARTINQIDRVSQARVHIAIPERNLFDKEEKHPQASIVVKLKPGGTLAEDQVAGIVHLVASAVEGLEPNNVTIIDTRGNVLSEANDSNSPFDARLSATQLHVKQSHERDLQKNIESMLERVLGPNKAIVRVSAKVNFDQKETSCETFEPVKAGAQRGTTTETGQSVDGYKGVLTSEQRMQETYAPGSGPGAASPMVGGAPGRVGGIAGVTSNTRPGGTVTASETSNGYTREETTSKYEVSKTTEHVVQTPGAIEQISVAVMLDHKVGLDQVPAIRRVVEASAGIDAKRGDKVIVESVPFDDTAAKEEDKEMAAVASRETYTSVGKTALGVLLLGGFLFFLKGMLRQVKIGAPELNPGQPRRQQTAVAAALIPMAAGVSAAPVPTGPREQTPEDVAQVVKEWLSN